MSRLNQLKFYFTGGTAENEGRFISKAFVIPNYYPEVLTPPSPTPRIVIGTKGSGKSATLTIIEKSLKSQGIPCVFLYPKDINLSNSKDDASIGEMTSDMEVILLKSIASKVGSRISGLTTQDKQELRKIAKSDGLATDDLIEKSLTILKPIGKAVSKIDFSKMLPDNEMSSKKTIQILKNYFQEDSTGLYVIIDDTDQIMNINTANHLNRIWALMLAARHISREIDSIKMIISLRTEIWNRLENTPSSQRDQLDHFRFAVTPISNSASKIKEIIQKRFQLATGAEKFPENEDYLPQEFFEYDYAEFGDDRRKWMDVLVTNSRLRPRDAIQLFHMIINDAGFKNQNVIKSENLLNVLLAYSTEKINDLSTETEYDCAQTEAVVRCFSKFKSKKNDMGDFTCDSEETMKFIKQIPTKFRVIINGKILNESRDSGFILWKFLYEIGFLSARTSDSTKSKKYTYINPLNDLNLVSPLRWNDMQKCLWEVHLAYRPKLLEIRKGESLYIGLPTKPNFKKR